MNALTGTRLLTRLALRRDRVRIPVWTLAITGLSLYGVTALGAVYSSAADRQSRAALMESPAAVMMSGPGYGLEDYTLGRILANEFLLTLIIAAAIMNILLVVRHTRAEEEAGRAEMIQAGVVGRHARTTAALLTASVANTAIAGLTAAALVSGGLAGPDSLAFGVGLGLTGMVFAAVTAVTAQVNEHGRAASGLALAVLGVAFVVRAAGDVAERHGSPLSWFSPIAWAQQTRAFVELRWWPLLLSVALVAVLVPAAYALSVRRDVGAGLVSPRQGRADATPALASPFALALRLQRGMLIAWGIGLFVMALAMGSLSSSVADSLAENPVLAEVFGADSADLTNGYFAVMALFNALLVGAFTVPSALRLRSEESSGRAEPMLATGVSRWRWMGSWLAVTVLGSAVLLAVSGLGLALTAASGTSEGGLVGTLVGAHLAFLPALLVLASVVAFALGLRPTLAGLAWVVLAYGLVTGMFGELLGLADWMLEVSPFGAVPALPSVELDVVPLVLLTAIAAVLTAVGLVGFRRRDLETT